MTQPPTMLESAERLARHAHAHQFDKAGRPYIEHVERVVALISRPVTWGRSPVVDVLGPAAVLVGWLHDVVEDGSASDRSEVLDFPANIVAAVHAITRRREQTEQEYLNAILANPLAWRVKLADIADNADPERLKLLEPEVAERLRAKYTRYRSVLLGDYVGVADRVLG